MDDFTKATYIIGGTIVVVGCILLLAYRLQKQRTEAMKKAAQMMGFSFSPKKEMSEIHAISVFRLFNQGHSKRIRNFLQGSKDQVSWRIFDYRYTTGGGKSSNTSNQTVVSAEIKSSLPGFFLGKEHVFLKLAEKFGYQDIDFDTHPAFSDKYILRGDEAGVRKLFKPEVLEFFERAAIIYTIEAKGNDIIIYRRSRKVKPAQLRQYLDEMTRIVKLFEKSAENYNSENNLEKNGPEGI